MTSARAPWLLLFGLTLAAHAQQATAPFPLVTPFQGRVSDAQRNAVALSSPTPFVVWEDRRDTRTFDLYGTRVSAQGQPLDVPSLPLVRGAGNQTLPAGAWGPPGLLVAYLDDAVGACASEVMAQLFAEQGTALAPAARLTTGACTPGRPAVAWLPGPDRYLVVWGGHGSGQDLHGALVDPTGAVVVPDFVIAAAANSAKAPAVTATSSGFLVAWQDDRGAAGRPLLYTASVSATGTVAQAQPVSAPTGAEFQAQPALALDSSVVLATWVEGTGTTPAITVKSRLLTEDGVPALATVTVKSGSSGVSNPAVRSPATGYWLVAWEDGRTPGAGIYGAAMDALGTLSPEVQLSASAGSGARQAPSLAPAGNGTVVTFHGDANDYMNGLEVQASVALLGVPGPSLSVQGAPVFLSSGATRARFVNAAFSQDRYLASWRADGINQAGGDLQGQLVASGTGAVLGPPGGLRLTVSSANLGSYPSVAANDGGFFVTWGDDSSGTLLKGRRVTVDGGLPDATPPTLNDVSNFIVDHATRWFVDSFVTVFPRNFSPTLSLRRTAADATRAQAEVVLFGTSSNVTRPSLAQSQDTLLAVFHATDAGLDVHGARWRHGVGQLDPAPFLITQRPGNQVDPAAAGGPGVFLVAWSEPGGGPNAPDVFCARVDLDAGVLDAPRLLSTGTGADSVPTVAWTGSSFLAVWVRGTQLVGARVSSDGVVLDAQPLVFSGGMETQLAPRLAEGPPGEALLTWEAFDPAAGVLGIVPRALLYQEGAVDAGVDAGGVDAGVADSGVDAGSVDAGAADSGVDAGSVDAGAPDSGVDAGTADAGVADSGVGVDGGSVDGGLADAGAGTDAGAPDTGVDAGSEDAGHQEPRSNRWAVGCDCAHADGPGLLALLAVMVVLGPGRRRAR